MCITNCICLRQTIPIPCKRFVQKLLMITFPSYFLILITDSLYTIMSYELLTNNMLITFDHSLCNLKHITFLIITWQNISNFFLSALHLGR